MSFNDIEYFNEITAKLGNPYAAVNYIAASARKLAAKYNNLILDSEAINWLVTDNKPAILNKQHTISTKGDYVRSYVDEMLSYVDDTDVCDSVRYSINTSRDANHLIYVYTNVPDEFRQARVRILTRMIWYNLNLSGGNNNEES